MAERLSLGGIELKSSLGFIWLAEIPITVSLFTGWIALTEWVENRFYHHAKSLFQRHHQLTVQLATLLIAGLLSVGFDWAFFEFFHRARTAFDQTQPLPAPTQPRDLTSKHRSRKAVTALTVMALLMAYYLAANRRRDKVVTLLEVSAEQLKRQAAQAQFDALKNQVNPHFLFNSLSILSSLVEINPKMSVQFIKQLTRVYRYILEQQAIDRVPLMTELNVLEAYCFLVNIRFGGKFQFINMLSQEDTIRFSIAPLTLQLLLENALKHNQMSSKQPLVVTLSIQDEYLLVSNPIRLRLPDKTLPQASTGVGLTNISSRYRLLTARPVLISQQDSTFIVHIPLLACR